MEISKAVMWLPTGLENNASVLAWVAVAVLLEVAAYLTLVSERSRRWWRRELVVALAPLSYVAYAVPVGVFDVRAFLVIVAAVALVTYWYSVLPKGWPADTGFIVLMAVPIAFKLIALVYARPIADVRLEFLGHLLWIRAGTLAIERGRGLDGTGFGFWPTGAEWRIGTTWFAALLPFVFVLSWVTGFAAFKLPVWPWWEIALRAAGQFFGILWVVALSEELFFRGILQRWLGLVWTSVLFGMVHLGFREFPNWRFAIVAALTGIFYGMAFQKAGGIRAAMVTHALTVTTWKILFR
jgi:membrane protease YdiL (CAAX protease family)